MRKRRAIFLLTVMTMMPIFVSFAGSSGLGYNGAEALAEILMDVFNIDYVLALLIASIVLLGGIGVLVATCWFSGVGCGLAAAVAAFLAEYPDLLHL